MGGSDEVHHALGWHVVRIRTIRNLAAFQKRVARQQLQYLQLRLDFRRAIVDAVVAPLMRGRARSSEAAGQGSIVRRRDRRRVDEIRTARELALAAAARRL